MKTRIRIVEKNDSSKTFHCEYKIPFELKHLLLIFLPFFGWWFLLSIIFEYEKIAEWLDLQNAKECIDHFIQRQVNDNYKAKMNKIKSITYLKYP